jgi:hypothetical protein
VKPIKAVIWHHCHTRLYPSFWTSHLEQELKMVQLSATRCSCIAILWVSLLSFAAITLCVTSQQVIPKVSVYFVINSVQELLDTPLYILRGCFKCTGGTSFNVIGVCKMMSNHPLHQGWGIQRLDRSHEMLQVPEVWPCLGQL